MGRQREKNATIPHIIVLLLGFSYQLLEQSLLWVATLVRVADEFSAIDPSAWSFLFAGVHTRVCGGAALCKRGSLEPRIAIGIGGSWACE